MPGKIIRQRFHCNEVPRCASARLWVGFLTALAVGSHSGCGGSLRRGAPQITARRRTPTRR
jgi:hypothetical protein